MDRSRLWISAIPMLLTFLVGSAIALLTTQRLPLFPLLGLGDFLGLKTPAGLSTMRRTKA